ncbi:MAG TPA: nucleotidyltransferase domain-containing protein [Candidatus Limnocylindrales bacterium]|nr:nucleotidyltransferase domain-containing protein [Candidatus Limnocylindrales bacterium]
MLSKITPVIASKPEIEFAYLFGSVAAETAGMLSDVDLAVYVDSACEIPASGFGYQSELITELAELLACRVDVVILNDASIMLKHQVIKNGILVYSRSHDERRAFHEKAVREYLDFKPLLKVQGEYIRKRLLAGTFGGE